MEPTHLQEQNQEAGEAKICLAEPTRLTKGAVRGGATLLQLPHMNTLGSSPPSHLLLLATSSTPLLAAAPVCAIAHMTLWELGSNASSPWDYK